MAVCLCSVSPAAQVADRPLERAVKRIEKNDADGLRRLLAQDPSLVRGTGAGLLPHWHWTLLHLATSRKASLDVVSALVDAGSDVNAQDNEGNTPLHFAVKRIKHETFPKADYDGIIRLLLEKKADVHIVNVAGASPLHTSVRIPRRSVGGGDADPSGRRREPEDIQERRRVDAPARSGRGKQPGHRHGPPEVWRQAEPD